MIALFRDEGLRKLGGHVRQMATGKIVGAVLHLAAMALTARFLGPVAFGVLVLVRGYATAVSGLVKFQSWQAVVQYGSRSLASDDRQRFANLVAFTAALDVATGLLAAGGAALLVSWAGPAVGLASTDLGAALVYCLAIPTMTAASPTGVLRLLDRFDLLGVQSVVTPAVRLLGVGLAALSNASPAGYIAAWLISDLVGDLFLWVCALAILRRRRLLAGVRFRPFAAPREEAGLWRFLFATNGSATLDLAWGAGSTLVIGGMLGPAAAGSYRISLQIFEALVKPAELAARSFYPEVTRLAAAGDLVRLRDLGGRVILLSTIFGVLAALVMAAGGTLAVKTALGADYAAAAGVLRAMAPALFVTVTAYPFESMLLAMGRAVILLRIRAVSTAVFAVILLPACHEWGLTGAGLSYSAAAATLAALQVYMLRKTRPAP